MSFFCDLRVLAKNTCELFGQPTQVSTQVQVAATCDYLPLRLAKILKGGAKSKLSVVELKANSTQNGPEFFVQGFGKFAIFEPKIRSF